MTFFRCRSGLRPGLAAFAGAGLAAALAATGCGGCGGSGGDSDRRDDPEARRVDPPAEIDPARLEALRALPYAVSRSADEGEPDGVVHLDSERACPGYRFVTIGSKSEARLLERDGEIVKTWSLAPSERWARAELLPDGGVLAIGATRSEGAPGVGGRVVQDADRYLVRLDRDGDVRWRREARAHHDVEITPTGEVLVLEFARRLLPDLHPEVPLRDDLLVRLEAATGAPIDTLSIWDAIAAAPERFPLKRQPPTRLGGPPWLDWFHSNSVEWSRRPELAATHPIHGPERVLVCFRNQQRIAAFDWKTREVVWAWGDGEISGAHDAQVLPGGNVLLFDNGLGRGWSRGVELDPTTGEIVWEWRAEPPRSFFTMSRGSIQRLPNGNTLMAESDRGRAIEVTPDGEIVWEYVCPEWKAPGERAVIVRVRHLSTEEVGAMGLGES